VSDRAKVRQRGQVTIPASVRRSAQIKEGSTVEFEVVADGILLRPLTILDEDVSIDAAFARDVITRTVAGYAALRDDPERWAAELREREELDGTLGDGLDA
jgi:AbrB family looped-hinge helix DNA binding protein